MPSIWQESLRSLNGRLKFSEGESPKFRGPLDLADQWKVKAECLSTLISSGGVVAVGSGSTRVVDLVLEFSSFQNSGCGESCDSESRVVNSRFVKSR
jgi:hypothetical protein